MTKEAFAKLQAKWYRKLRTTKFDINGRRHTNGEKFIDIEGGIDLNLIDGSTFSGKDKPGGFKFFNDKDISLDGPIDVLEKEQLANIKDFGTYTPLANTDTAILYRELAIACNSLPPKYKHRAYLIDVSNVGCHASYLLKRHKLTKKTARWAWKLFCERPGNARFSDLLIGGKVRKSR